MLMTQYQSIPTSFEEEPLIHLLRVQSPFGADNTFISKEDAYAFQQVRKLGDSGVSAQC